MLGDYVNSLVARFVRRRRDPFRQPPEDPLVGVREPLKRGPTGRSSSVAVCELSARNFVQADASQQYPTGRGGSVTR